MARQSLAITSNMAQFARQVNADFNAFRVGSAVSLGTLAAAALNQIARDGFVHMEGKERRVSSERFTDYPSDPRFNLKSKDQRRVYPSGKVVVIPGKPKFMRGQIVSRKGRLPADLADMKLQKENNIGLADGVIAVLSNNRSKMEIVQKPGLIKMSFEPNPKNKLAWLGFEFGTGVAKAMSVVLADGSIAKAVDQKRGQRRVIQRGLNLALKFWRLSAKGAFEKWISRRRVGDA